MIQPTLTAYSIEQGAHPVLLDATSAVPACILLLDTFFHVVVWYGATIVQWRNDRIQDRPDYAYFGDLLKAPLNDAQGLMQARFPSPLFVECEYNAGSARFLMAKLNPSVTYHTGGGAEGVPIIPTDDVSFEIFSQHLRRLATAPPS